MQILKGAVADIARFVPEHAGNKHGHADTLLKARLIASLAT